MNCIAAEEFENVLERIINNDISRNDEFAGYDEFEGEYCHNEIEESWYQLEEKLNEHFLQNNLPYIAFVGIECIRVWRREWYEEKFCKSDVT